MKNNEQQTTGEKLDLEQFKTEEFFDASFNFWYSDHGKVRSPFPDYIRETIKPKVKDRFIFWLENLDTDILDEEELNEEAVVQKFEQILFETGLESVKTEDEKITLMYPFMPRVGDPIEETVSEQNNGHLETSRKSTIVDRALLSEEDTKLMKVKCEREDGSTWSTKFELPA